MEEMEVVAVSSAEAGRFFSLMTNMTTDKCVVNAQYSYLMSVKLSRI
jgi:hypothetical protein